MTGLWAQPPQPCALTWARPCRTRHVPWALRHGPCRVGWCWALRQVRGLVGIAWPPGAPLKPCCSPWPQRASWFQPAWSRRFCGFLAAASLTRRCAERREHHPPPLTPCHPPQFLCHRSVTRGPLTPPCLDSAASPTGTYSSKLHTRRVPSPRDVSLGTVTPGSSSCWPLVLITCWCRARGPSLGLPLSASPIDVASTQGSEQLRPQSCCLSAGHRALPGTHGAGDPGHLLASCPLAQTGRRRPEGSHCRAGLPAVTSSPVPRTPLTDFDLCLPGPDWASYTLGVFICLSCSGIHRNIPQVSKVKSVRLDTWEEAQVEVCPAAGDPQDHLGAWPGGA